MTNIIKLPVDKKLVLQAIKEAILITQKPYLTFSEVMWFCNRRHSATYQMLKDFGIKKTVTGHCSRLDIEQMLGGQKSLYSQKAEDIKINVDKKMTSRENRH